MVLWSGQFEFWILVSLWQICCKEMYVTFIIFPLIGVGWGFMDVDLTLAFLEKSSLRRSVIITCEDDKKDHINLWKKLSQRTMVFQITHIQSPHIHHQLFDHYRKIGVVVDADCPYTQNFLIKSGHRHLFDTRHYWLLLHKNTSYEYLLERVNSNVDSYIKLAYPYGGNYIIDDAYNPAYLRGGKLRRSKVGLYDGEYKVNEWRNKYFVRRDMSGVTFRTVIVLPESFEEPLEDYLLNDRNIEVNTFNRFHSRLMHYCGHYHNFSMNISMDKSWGYLQTDGSMDGLVGDLYGRHTDFGLSPLFVKEERRPFITYGRKTWNLKAAFILKNPKSRETYQIFIKPLSYRVWTGIVLTSILSVLCQKVGYTYLEKKLLRHPDVDTSWSFSTVCTFGAFSQQGIVSSPKSLSGKTVAFSTLWLGMLIYQFYSASLVSFLLNVPTTVISSVQDILDNQFAIGCQDILYQREYFKNPKDNLTKEIYKKLSAHNHSGFLKPEVGLHRVKAGQYAFHVELVTGYPIIVKTFDETTICGLKEVPIFQYQEMHANYQRWSPFKDLLDVCLHRLSENGVMKREMIFWHPRKPQCIRSGSTITVNTGLQDFYPALVILVLGMALSVEILLVEVIVHQRGLRRRLKAEESGLLYPFLE